MGVIIGARICASNDPRSLGVSLPSTLRHSPGDDASPPRAAAPGRRARHLARPTVATFRCRRVTPAPPVPTMSPPVSPAGLRIFNQIYIPAFRGGGDALMAFDIFENEINFIVFICNGCFVFFCGDVGSGGFRVHSLATAARWNLGRLSTELNVCIGVRRIVRDCLRRAN